MMTSSVPLTDYIANNYYPVPETGCWLWAGAWNFEGYGKISGDRGRPTILVHRLFFHAFTGINPAGMLVCHKCDTRPCVNPEHLYLGTDADNASDRKQRGRSKSSHYSRRLTPEQAASIRVDPRRSGLVAADYGISKRLVRGIRNGTNWRNA